MKKSIARITTIFTAAAIALGSAGIAVAKNDKEKELPPGLQKKVEQGKPLPPGWQKKLAVGEPLDKDVYEQGKVLETNKKDGTVTVEVEDKVIKVMEDTRTVIDILTGNS